MTYQKGKIYQLRFKSTEKIYIGSTIQPLKDRLSGHRRKAVNKKVASIINEHGKHDMFIVLLEKYPCADKDELRQREQYWIDKLKPELNHTNAYSMWKDNPHIPRTPLPKPKPIYKPKGEYCEVCRHHTPNMENHKKTPAHINLHTRITFYSIDPWLLNLYLQAEREES